MGANLTTILLPMVREKDEALARLAKMTDAEILESLEPWTVLEEPDEDDARKIAEDAVKNVYSMYERGSRHCESHYIGGVFFLVVGGDSWGDTPEGYNDAEIVFNLGVTFDDEARIEWVRNWRPRG